MKYACHQKLWFFFFFIFLETVIVKGWVFHGVFMLRADQKYHKQKFCQTCLLPFTRNFYHLVKQFIYVGMRCPVALQFSSHLMWLGESMMSELGIVWIMCELQFIPRHWNLKEAQVRHLEHSDHGKHTICLMGKAGTLFYKMKQWNKIHRMSDSLISQW